MALAPVYYPAGTNVSQAGVISLRTGEERDGIDFALQLVSTARIDGSVTLPEGGVPSATEVHLIAVGATAIPGMPVESYRTSRPSADGTFWFAAVPPGLYTVLARGARPITNADGSSAAPQHVWASTQIAVDGEPIAGLALSLQPALTIAGRVQFRESSLKPPDPKAIRVTAQPFETQSTVIFAPAAVTASEDGRFSIPGVVPGRYRLSASFPGSGRAGGWTIESVTANAQDALDAAFTILPDQHVLDALVTFTDRVAQISGTVRTAGGFPGDYTAVLFPADERLWIPQSRRIQGTRAGPDGAYAFRSVPSGAYLLALTDDVENGEWFDPALLRRISSSALRISVADGERKTQDLTPGPVRIPD